MFDWNDLRHFLAAARGGSTVAAAESLGVSQSTVSRRIASLEKTLRAKLFHKSVSGYRLTELGRDLVPFAERAECETEAIRMLVEQKSRIITGTIKITTNETVADLVLTPSLAEFVELYPDIRVNVIVSPRRFDLKAGEADVALRTAQNLATDGLVARRISSFPWAIYCSQGYAKVHGVPIPEELSRHRAIAMDGPIEHIAPFEWLLKNVARPSIVARTNDLPNLLAAVRAGLGLSALPCATGEADPELIRCMGPNEAINSCLWLATAAHMKDEPTIRAFSSFIVGRSQMIIKLLDVVDNSPVKPGITHK